MKPATMPSNQASALDPDGQAEACFHCGLPIPEEAELPVIQVLDEPRSFCCGGCYAVCEAIVDSGLEDYYRFRTDNAPTGSDSNLVPDFLERMEVYDRPEVQKGFVRTLARGQEASLLLEEIRCPACLWLNERHVRRQPGVLEVSTDTTTQRMRVRWDPGVTKLSKILKAIADIGYIAHPYDASHSEQLNRLRKRRSIERLIFAGLLGMVVMNFSIATYVMGEVTAEGELPLWITIGRWTGLFVCLTLLAYPGQDFFIGAWRDLRNRQLGMDVPIVIGLSAAFAGSLHATITGHGEVYLDSIAMFVFFVLIARYFETRGRVRSVAYLDRLGQAVPAMARKVDTNGEVKDTLVIDLQAGDIVQVLPGEQVPIDGVVVSGQSSFDESLLTGESAPLHHGIGDSVVAGSVNREQAVQVAMTVSAGGNTIEQIVRLVDHGMEQRPRAATLAEYAARWFVTAVLIIAVSTASYWLIVGSELWLPNTIAVLIVTCPCALALATPVSLSVGMGRYINAGILPLRMAALDELARSEQVVFDKTGTLTLGQLRLVKVVPLESMGAAESLRIAVSLLTTSEHPVARSIRNSAPGDQADTVSVDELNNVPGFGVEGVINDQQWRIGRPDFSIDQPGTNMPDEVSIHESQGYTVTLLANEAVPMALFILEDTVRPGTTGLVQQLQDAGIKDMAIVSGDSAESVARIGQQLHIEQLHSRMKPAQKLEWVQAHQQTGGPVVMVGDGINDAPTLAAADVSISLASSTDLANASSDFLLMHDDLQGVVDAIRISREVRRNIRQNLLWAVTYNMCAVPLAAMGYIAPWAAAIGMSASSIIVVFNALRLQSRKDAGR